MFEIKEEKEKFLKNIKVKIVVFLCTTICLLLSLFLSDYLERFINQNYYFNLSKEILNSCVKVHFIDVGQGDCIFIELPNNKKVMIDTGDNKSEDRVKRYLTNLGINNKGKIDYLILTHTDSDHVGNAKMVLDNYKVENIYLPMVYSNYEVENNLLKEEYNINKTNLWEDICKSVNAEVKDGANKYYSFKDLVIEDSKENYSFLFLSPFNTKESASNNYSSIILFNFAGFKFLFTGDAEEKVEDEFLQCYKDVYFMLDVDVLKVSHHGSKGATSEQFLDVVKPEYSVISCGKENDYAHPNNETINRLTNANSCVLRTDTTSSIVFGINSQVSTPKMVIETSYDKFSNTYFYWWYFVVCGIVICGFLIFAFKIKG